MALPTASLSPLLVLLDEAKMNMSENATSASPHKDFHRDPAASEACAKKTPVEPKQVISGFFDTYRSHLAGQN